MALVALVALSTAAASSPAGAAGAKHGNPGGLDPTFGTGGIASLSVDPDEADRLIDIAPTTGGRVYAVGTTRSGGSANFAVSRILGDGSFDTSFGGTGTALLDIDSGGTTEVARGVGVQEDGKIVISGQAASRTPGADPRDRDVYVARFNPDGSQDTSFAGGAGVLHLDLSPGALVPDTTNFRTDQTYGLDVGKDDKIVLNATRGPGGTPGRFDRDWAIVRLTPDGALDPTWDGDGIRILDTQGPGNPNDDAAIPVKTRSLNESPRQLMIEPNGKVVVASYSEGVPDFSLPLAERLSDGRATPRLIRFNKNGSLDTKFGIGGIATVPRATLGDPSGFFHPNDTPGAEIEFYDVAKQGKSYVVCGYGGPGTGAPVDAISTRFTADGKVDTTYGTNGAVTIDMVGQEDRCRDLEVLGPDGRVLLSGSSRKAGTVVDIDAMLVVLDRNGQRMSSFGDNGVQLFDFGGSADSIYGITQTGNRTATAVGFKGFGTSTASDRSDPFDDGRAIRYTYK